MPILSVIIPVYNVAPYLRSCLDSVCTAVASVQKERPNFSAEVICVDDGSTDGSGKILDEYVAKREVKEKGEGEQRIIVIHQKNAGVSAARNAALDLAGGEWVAFLDGDDKWSPDLLVHVWKLIGEHSRCDAVAFSLCRVDAFDHPIANETTEIPVRVVMADDVLGIRSGPYARFVWSSCDKFYRKSIIERANLRFTEWMKLGEDCLFTQRFFAAAKEVVLTPGLLGYRYFVRQDSAIHARLTEILPQPFYHFMVLYNYWLEHGKKDGLRRRLLYMAMGAFYLGLRDLYEPCARAKGIDYLLSSKEFNGSILPFVIFNGSFRARAFALVYLCSPKCIRRVILERLK